MTLINAIKGPFLGLLLMFSFATFILSIIYTNHEIVYTTVGYPPAIVALLVAGAVHALYNLWLLAFGRRRKFDSAMNIIALQGLFAAWYFALAVFLTAKRYTTHYCANDANRVASDCLGIYKAELALVWFDFGFTLIYIGMVAVSVTKYGSFRTPDGDLMPEDELEARGLREKTGH